MRLSFLSAAALAVTLAPSAGAGAGTVTPEAVTAALPLLERQAQAAVDRGDVPGLSIAVVYRDEVVFLKGFGRREAGQPAAVDADTVFQLASCSKPIASTVVAALVSAGTVTWDTRIADIDPGFALAEAYPTQQLTIRDLFAHRSGLPGEAGNELEALGYDRDEILHRLRQVAPASSFRAGYSYSNFGITEGAVAAAKAAGMAWEDAAQQLVYAPLGMASTSSRHADFLSRPDRAALHVRVGGDWQAKLTRDPDAQSPAGGVSSTARDMAQWLRLELGRGRYAGQDLIRRDALDQTHQPLMARGANPVTGAAAFYGLGWNVEYGRHGLQWDHAGAFSVGARTLVSLYPDDGIGIVILANAFPTGVPEGLADSFFDQVFDGRVTQDWPAKWGRIFDGLFGPAVAASQARYGTPPASPSPALPAAAYAGRYANAYLGTAAVVERQGTLWLTLGPRQQAEFPLRHFDRDLFVYAPSAETPDLLAAVTFRIGPDQVADQVTIEDLDDLGLGVLTRAAP
ncbi:serine hydrolase [Inquilinus sp. 2KB_12]|uniref:CubicO group peptidase (Beta-lactamase class C family) n=1 Tax=Inquilinus ginsengisoli TaxID=363840 RepID=A0ABU1JZH9_9PROT|nr:serine hydrolase [Inquilinus ginsengisoli]MDR6294035.1 CubicO group peptidase (beta-lactamase class C family) [Inquilinus ginsengisoli]